MERKPTAPKIIIAGAPAAGKGTQCEVIKEQLGVIHLSTGDIENAFYEMGTPSDLSEYVSLSPIRAGLAGVSTLDGADIPPDLLLTPPKEGE